MNSCNDVVTVDGDGKITIRAERMEVEHIYPCIFNDRVLLFIKDEDGIINCYEVEDEYLKSKIMDNPSHNSIVMILQQIIDNKEV